MLQNPWDQNDGYQHVVHVKRDSVVAQYIAHPAKQLSNRDDAQTLNDHVDAHRMC